MGALPFLIIGILLVIAVVIFLALRKGGRGGEKGVQNSQLKEALRRLAVNPRDPKALQTAAEACYKTEDWSGAAKHYKMLFDMAASTPGLDELEITVKYALSCRKLKNIDEAYRAFLYARTKDDANFEVNHSLGAIEHERGNHEKAAGFLGKALSIDAEHPLTAKLLGASLVKLKRYREAVPVLRKTLEFFPEDKDSLFSLGSAYLEAGQNDLALKIFAHLRTDPKLGPMAALYSGTIHLNAKLHDDAVMDFELGLKHEGIKPEIVLELKYRLAAAYVKKDDIGRATALWREIFDANPKYKDVPDLLGKYREMSSNKKLQIYLMSPTSEFVTLCRKMAASFYPKSKTKLTNISFRQSEYVDIVAEVDTSKWSDTVLFRFSRVNGVLGELVLRDLYAKLKEIKGGRGICVCPGSYSEGAKAFVEARIIDLIDKGGLIKLLARLPDGL